MKSRVYPRRSWVNKYSEYKSSNIDWIGQIPSHWEVVQPKYKLNRVTRPYDESDEVITCFRDGVVTLRKNRREDGFTVSIKEHGYQQILPGDLVVHEMDGFEGSIGISDSKGKSTPVYTVIEPDERCNLKYISYLLHEMSKTGKIKSLSRSIRERTTDFRWNMWSVTHFPFPPKEEQDRISRYLDKKTQQIDSLIEKIQKKIELLKEQRTSLINQFVTKGLDPNVEMKDSGVEWIGQIPKHWKMNRLCNLGRFKKGKNITKNDLVEVGHPVILYSHLYTTYQRTVTEPKFFISSDTESNSTKIYKNTFLFTSSGESLEDIGKCLLFLGIETSVGGDQVIFELNNFENFDPVFFSFTFNSEFCVHQKSSNSRGEIVVHIYEKQLREIRVPVPPLNEQFEIREKLVDFENTSTKLVDKLETKIKVLKEYRQSLISSVVTGKVRVSEDMI